MSEFCVSTFYKFIEINNFSTIKPPLLVECNKLNIKGTILLANEGINATISGTNQNIDKIIEFLKKDERLTDLKIKKSFSDVQSFQKMKIRLKKEIVKLGVENIKGDYVNNNCGTYLDHEEWDRLIEEEDTVVIDTRNTYEIKMGKFKNAINPKITSFCQLPDWILKWKQSYIKKKEPKVLMYCTGGIRCEKSTAYMKSIGFSNVYHLKDGILGYLKKSKNKGQKWEGECFVFDDRIGVDNEIQRIKSIACNKCNVTINLDNDIINDSFQGTVLCNTCDTSQRA